MLRHAGAGGEATHQVATVNAGYVRVHVITSTQDGDPAARRYELEVYR